MKNALRFSALAALALVLGACAGDLSPGNEDDPGNPPGQPDLPGPGGAQVAFSRHADGYYQAIVDASGSDWVYVDLDTQTQVFPANPEASDAWDLAHKGVDIKLNGGVSGAPPSGAEVAVHAHKVAVGTAYPFASVDEAPPPGSVDYVSDADGLLPILNRPAYAMSSHPEADAQPNAATGAGDYGWYHYSGFTAGSQITARSNVGYVLRTLECRYYKLRMTAYTDGGGASGHPRYDLLEIPGPDCAGGDPVAPLGRIEFTDGSNGSTLAAVNASDESAWVYVDLTNALQVAPANAASDPNGWDIALRRSDIKLNGGSSGAGSVAIHDILRDDWDARAAVPADAQWHGDENEGLAFATRPPAETQPRAACGNINGDFGWYYYSGFCNDGDGVHHISPRDAVYIVRGRDGNHWKLRMLGYYDAGGASGHPSFEYSPVAAP